jgi:hypothetical protein
MAMRPQGLTPGEPPSSIADDRNNVRTLWKRLRDRPRPHRTGRDTTRCPSCGHNNAVAAADGSGEPGEDEIAASVNVDGGEDVHIHIHIHRE